MEGPGKEEDLCWRTLFLRGADDGRYRFEVILLDKFSTMACEVLGIADYGQTRPRLLHILPPPLL